MNLSQADLQKLVALWLAEDVGTGDISTTALIKSDAQITTRVVAKEEGVVFGMKLLCVFLEELGAKSVLIHATNDGSRVKARSEVLKIQSSYPALLKAERSFLNLVQHLSGVATITARYVEAVKGTRAKILDTRKTQPGLRQLAKAAVLAGGGCNHRIGLFDEFLIKENHLAAFRNEKNPFAAAIQKARAYKSGVNLIIEVASIEECMLALEASPEVILLDNMSTKDMSHCVNEVDRLELKTQLEASGGIDLNSVRKVAETGVHRISVGSLTHSVKCLDLSMLMEVPKAN